MKKRELLLISFFFFSILFYSFPNLFLTPFSFLGNITNGLRSNLYTLAHAENKNDSYQKLEAEIKKLREQLLEMEAVKKDNDALRSQFQETFLQPRTLIPAKVVGFRGKYTKPTSLYIDQGEKSGVKKNSAVVVGKDLVGKIGNVSSYNAEVVLTNSSDFSTLVYDGKTNAPGIISGQEDLLLLDHVVITDEINKNDPIFTKGEVFENDAIIPEGLLVGSLKDVQKSETKPFQTGIVSASVVTTKLLMVFVVTE